jgi:hypothetical protein
VQKNFEPPCGEAARKLSSADSPGFVAVRDDRDRLDVGRNGVGEMGQEGRAARRPGAKAGRIVRRQSIFDAFVNRDGEEIVRRRDDDRHALGRADRALLDLDGGLVGAVRLERDQLDGVDIERRAQDAGLGLLRDCEGGDERGRIVVERPQEA